MTQYAEATILPGTPYMRTASEEKPQFRQKQLKSKAPAEMKLAPAVQAFPQASKSHGGDEWREDTKESRRPSFAWKANMNENLFHRSKEAAAVVQCYESMFNEEKTKALLFVSGPAGTGKTRLVKHALQRLVQDQGGFFITGKFDQLCRPEPYRGYVSAFTEFTNQVVERGPETVKAMREAIHEAIGNESAVLISMIPALEKILGGSQGKSSDGSRTDDAIQRFVFVFRMFMRAVSSINQPLVLVLDDLHFADRCSRELLASVVLDLENNPGLFLVGTSTCENEACNMNNPIDCRLKTAHCELFRVLRDMQKSGSVGMTHICLKNLTEGEVNHLLGNVFQISRLDRSEELGRIVSGQTNGNLFYIVEFVRWLQDNDLLVFNAHTESWEWDAEEIRMEINVGHVGDFLNDKLAQLPMEMQDVLKVAACLGSTPDQELIEYALDRPVGGILADAAAIGLLVRDTTLLGNGTYSFDHDGIQEAAYNLIAEKERELFHLEIGRRLWRRLKMEDLDRNIFVLLSQMNIGKRLITREKERYSVSNLCLHAGKKAAKSSTFRTALVYLNLAIDLLDERSWRKEYDLTLAIYNAAAEMEMCTANFEVMEERAQAILLHTRSLSDKIQAHATQIYALGVTDRQQEALDLGIEVLKGLGERFPSKLCKLHVLGEFKSVQKLYKGKSNEQLLRLPSIENGEKLAALQILNLMYLPALMTRPKLSAFISLKLMKLTLIHGSCMLSPLSFSCFGMLCVSAKGDINAAFRFGELALELLEKLEAREYLPRVYAAFYGCIYAWKKPVRGTLEPLLHAYRVGMQTGDKEFACLNANLYCFNALAAGVPLGEIESTWATSQETMKSHRQTTLLRMSRPCMQSIHHYMGLSPDPLAAKGDLIDSDEVLKFTIENKLVNSAKNICMTRMTVAYVFNEYAVALEFAKSSPKKVWLSPNTFDHVFSGVMYAMSALGVAAEGKNARRNIGLARHVLKQVKRFARACPTNMLHMRYLLEAEIAAVCGKEEKALENYTCAIALAHEHSFLFAHALANERTARFLVVFEKLADAEPYFRKACSLYCKWGGKAKVERLQAEIEGLFGVVEAKPITGSFANTQSMHGSSLIQ